MLLKTVPTAVLTGLIASGWFIDLWLTPDQQGRFWFERGSYEEAAEAFRDSYWKGIAFYRSGDLDQAVNQFALMESPAAYFYLGNCYARLGDYPSAVASYGEALRLQADFPEAVANRELVEALIAKDQEQEEEPSEAGEPAFNPDEIKFDNKGKQGKEGEIEQSLLSDEQLAEMWMRNIQTSPADFLRYKFRVQTDRAREGEE